MIYSILKYFSFLTKPLTCILLLIISSFIFKRFRKKLAISSCILFFIFTNGFIIDELLRIWELPHINLEESYDIGIVLGGLCDYNIYTKNKGHAYITFNF